MIINVHQNFNQVRAPHPPPEASELSVVLCNDAHIRALNQEWREKDTATDVLSFPMDDDMPEGYPVRILGDVVISLDTAQRQAQERGCVPKP